MQSIIVKMVKRGKATIEMISELVQSRMKQQGVTLTDQDVQKVISDLESKDLI